MRWPLVGRADHAALLLAPPASRRPSLSRSPPGDTPVRVESRGRRRALLERIAVSGEALAELAEAVETDLGRGAR